MKTAHSYVSIMWYCTEGAKHWH